MIIENLRMETVSGRPRAAARVIWEECGRDDFELFYETTQDFAGDITCDPHAFLVACIFPAMHHGERRIRVEGQICPELKNGLDLAGGWIRKWYGPPRSRIKIESTSGECRIPLNKPPRAASFLSGGVDSLAALRNNRISYCPDHPGYIKDCFLVYGYDMGCFAHDRGSRRVYDWAYKHLSELALEAGFTLIPVSTNVRALHDDSNAFMMEYHGAMLASAAHVFSPRISSVSIASSISFDDFVPWGSHPFLECNCSSSELKVILDGFRFSRLEKVRIVSQWDAALASLRVCGQNHEGPINCGKCNKCIRTMLELFALDSLDRAVTFPSNRVSLDLVSRLRPGIFKYHSHYYKELYPYLHKKGRSDIVRMIERKRRFYSAVYVPAERLGLVRLARKGHLRIKDAFSLN